MNRTPLTILDLAGDPLDIACQIGKKRKKTIEQRVEFWNREIGLLYRGKKDQLKKLEKEFSGYTAKLAPDYLEEIRAMAEGAGIPFPDLFRLNLTELKAFVDKCTTVITKIKTSAGNRILIGHNEDWDPKRNDVFILKAHLPQLSYLIVAYDGYLPGLSCGFNSYGLVHAINYLPAPDPRPGLPRIFITRHLVTAKNVADCLSWIQKSRRAFGQSIHLAQKDRYLGIELTSQKMALRRPSLPTVHTNHYLAPQLKQPPNLSTLASRTRLQTANNILQNKWTQKKSILSVLSDRSHPPHSIWREGNLPDDAGATVVSALLQTGSQTMTLYRRHPSSSKPLQVSLA